jgi:polysaccharide chain length determinant protein (PEP-CTERM system associated)
LAGNEEGKNAMSLDSLLAIWGRRKWLAILAFVIPMSGAVGLITFLPNIYRSTVTVLVDRQQIPESFVQSTVTSALETRLHTISQEVLSRSRLEQLIQTFGLYQDLRTRVPFEDVLERTRKDIKLDLKSIQARGRGEATIAFALSYQGGDPEIVSRVTNTLASFYVEEDLKARERQASNTADFLKVQLDDTKRRLDEQEQQVSAFKRKHMGELPQQMEANLAALERLHTQLRINADNQTRASERRMSLQSQLAEMETLLAAQAAVPGAPTNALGAGVPTLADGPKSRLLQARQELTRLRTTFSEKYPDVVRLVAEIAHLEREVADAEARDREIATAMSREARPGGKGATDTAGQPMARLTPYVLRMKEALSEIEADLKVSRAEEKRLRDSIATYQARVDQIPKREQEFVELSRDYESTRELYKSLLKRYDEAQIAESMEQRQKGEQFRILDPAVPNPRPAAPARLMLLAMALVGSLGFAAAVVIAAEATDTSFHGVDDLRVFSGAVPVLVSIPWITTSAYRLRRERRMRLSSMAAAVAVVVIFVASYLVAHGNERLVALLARGGS